MVAAALAEPLGAPIVDADDDGAAADEAAAVVVVDLGASSTPPPTATTPGDPTTWPTYLLQFMHRFLDMREAEAQACAALAGVPRSLLPLDLPPAVEERGRKGGFRPALPQAGETAAPGGANTAFRTIRLPGPEAAAEVLRRSMLVRCILDVWGEGDSMDSLCADLKRKNAPELRAAKLGKEATWRLSVDGFGVAVGSKATREACERLAFLNLPGKVSLDDPDAVLRLIVIGGKEEGMEEEDIGDETEAKKKKSNSACSSLPPSLEPSFARRRFVLGLEVGTRLRHPKAGESYRKSKMHARDRTRVLSELALPKRPYIGPTSMDAEVAAIMCNLALVKKGSLVLDPCVGTGSILVAAASVGAHVMGCDIDLFALLGRPAARAARPLKKVAGTTGKPHARGEHGAAKYAKGDEGRAAAAAAVAEASVGLLDNFAAYKFPSPAGVLVADMSRLPFRRKRGASCSISPHSSSPQGFAGAFDAIIADPPYGVRAGGRKQAVAVGTQESGDGDEEEERGEEEGDETRAPPSTNSSGSHRHHTSKPSRAHARFRADGAPAPTAPYELGECLWDLLRLAASSLAVGGRLVFFLPARPGSGPEALPRHPCLRVVADCEQPLTRWYCRKLVALEKWRGFNGDGDEGGTMEKEEEEEARSSAGNLAAFAAATAVASGAYGELDEGEEEEEEDGGNEDDDGGDNSGSLMKKKKKKKKKKKGVLLKGRGKCV